MITLFLLQGAGRSVATQLHSITMPQLFTIYTPDPEVWLHLHWASASAPAILAVLYFKQRPLTVHSKHCTPSLA